MLSEAVEHLDFAMFAAGWKVYAGHIEIPIWLVD